MKYLKWQDKIDAEMYTMVMWHMKMLPTYSGECDFMNWKNLFIGKENQSRANHDQLT